ncbi:STAS domain-containing protein [Pseudomonas helleri]|jgi:anti-anti-sigma factor|uniref:STAS domain-containing protein n=1 Tax=Pseudomonas helleri TaxID=1608996 RepID=A0A7X1YDE8_9PSED|nr:STAS domain-containing protein [Pseudomonas helleri]KMN24215.1 anti-anti-sigma factor [Pseudomonas helleri]MQT77826.1 STAS domain-containing protein [Pseudomonas helleri]MQT96764.1 STAS domain-containing protein [Pseudomonas helleri]MQU35107.1 STAS domain-containing protein [Pseudomonas helleri]
MAVTSHVSAEGNQLTIAIKGRFDFAKHQEFRAAYEKNDPKPESVVVDLKEATYIDSSALGMLLLLRDHVGGDDAQIQVVNSSNDVRKTLAISNFDKLFDIK